MNSLGYPGKYTLLQSWKTRQEGLSWHLSEERQAFLHHNPIGELLPTQRPAEAYEVVLNEGQGEGSGFAMLIDWDMRPGPQFAAEFEGGCKAFFELRQRRGNGWWKISCYGS